MASNDSEDQKITKIKRIFKEQRFASTEDITLNVRDLSNQVPQTTFFKKNFYFLYSRFLLVIYFIHISVYMSIPISQFIPPPPPLPLSPLGVHTFVLYICVSISALQRGSSVPFFEYFKSNHLKVTLKKI